MIKKVLAALFLTTACLADQVGVSSFKYLNSNENSVIIDPSEAQDLLNVDITPGGKSFKKRSGYGLYKQVFATSSGVHGGFHGFDASGNDVQIWASSVSVKGIVADATPTTLVSSMTVNSTIDCADTQGFFYCVDSSRDFYIKTNGTSLTSWHTSPLGTMVEATPDRIAVAGISATPNTISLSGSNAFTTFTAGPLTTDPFTETIGAPGSKLTHLRWACQKLLWWKDQSFGYLDFDDQYSAQVKIVSDNIGTFDNTSAIDPGGSVWFRGQDGHVYQYDCSGLIKQTIEITPQIQSSGRRTANSYSESSQSDFQLGSIVPTGLLSTTLSTGEVMPSSFTATETLNATFSSGTLTNIQVSGNSIQISTSNTYISGSWGGVNSGLPANPYTNCGTINGKTGDGDAVRITPSVGANPNCVVEVLDANTSVIISSLSFAYADNSCTWTPRSLPIGDSNARRKLTVRFRSAPNNDANSSSPNFLASGDTLNFYTASDCRGGGCANKDCFMDADTSSAFGAYFMNGVSTITTGNYVSQAYDSALTPTYAWLSANTTIQSNSLTPTFSLQNAVSSTGTWTDLGSSTSTSYANAKRYLRYISSFTVTGSNGAQATVDDTTLLARSSGTYYSAVVNKPNLTSWSTLNGATSNNGGSHVFYLRSSSNSFTALSSTPAWTAQSIGNTISISTWTYFQLRDDFVVTAASHNPTLSDFTINWFEGLASDQAYMIYFDNSIWASVAYGVGVSSNNYVFKRDLINDGWSLYYFGAGGMLIQNNRLHFGSVSDGNVFVFGSGTSDNGNAINAYWKSKDFTAADPFVQSNLTQIDLFAKQNTGQSITSTYTTNTSSSTSYTVSLSSTTQSFVQNRKLLPSGKNGYTFNLKLGDTSSTSAWEVLGFRIGYTTLPWKPTQ